MSRNQTKERDSRELAKRVKDLKARAEVLYKDMVKNWTREKYAEYNVIKQKIEVTQNRLTGEFKEKNPGYHKLPNSSKKSNWG